MSKMGEPKRLVWRLQLIVFIYEKYGANNFYFIFKLKGKVKIITGQ